MNKTNKLKIFNDPIYGFINLNDESLFDIVEHSYFQRLRRITQLGYTYMVYPGAIHTRFQHSMGSMHLMKLALHHLKEKGIPILDSEMIAAQQAILLHDIGHGPFSHTLEHALLKNINHEQLGMLFMQHMNSQLNNSLQEAIRIIKNEHPKAFLHQLVSSQLDMDRLDYLKRDSYYTGVSEGVIGTERLINMLNVADDHLVVEAKGIYSVEKFLVARRIMYWQVYLHKTVLSAEQLLIEIIKRARFLAQDDHSLSPSLSLNIFLSKTYSFQDFEEIELLNHFALLDDNDIVFSLKKWQDHKDKPLRLMSGNLLNRKLPKVILQKESFEENLVEDLRKQAAQLYDISLEEASYFVYTGIASNRAYNQKADKIFIQEKNQNLVDIATASDNFNIKTLASPVNKYYLCYPKELRHYYEKNWTA